MPSIHEQPLTVLPELDELRQAIGWGPASWFLGPMIATGGCVLGRRNEVGELIGMGGSALFGNMGFICNMVVRPGLKRQGIGRGIFEALLSWLRERGVDQVQLEATEEGQPLYEQYGFRTRWESVIAQMVRPVEAGDEDGIAAIGAEDWAGIGALDRTATGSDRAAFLRALASSPHHQEGLRLVEEGRVSAFGFRYPGRIGPLVAATPSAAEKLARALATRAPEGTFATVGHPQHSAMWERLGFSVEPFDVRMALGPEPSDRPDMVISMLNGGVG